MVNALMGICERCPEKMDPRFENGRALIEISATFLDFYVIFGKFQNFNYVKFVGGPLTRTLQVEIYMIRPLKTTSLNENSRRI